MEMILNHNYVELCGTLEELPKYSHENHGNKFYTFPMSIPRLSGISDKINILTKEALLVPLALNDHIPIHVYGQIRTYNNKTDLGAKLIVNVFARDIIPEAYEFKNEVQLSGTICKQPNFRTTPLGREICDFMLAINRKYGKSDYIPCIAWGINAREISKKHIGETIKINGRLQSRQYIKLIENNSVEKTAYEVSIVEFE